MSKKRNRNRSVRMRKERTEPACSMRDRAHQYALALRRHIREMKLDPIERMGMDMDALRLNRRIDAIVNTSADFLSVLESHDMETSSDDADFWLRLNLGMIAGPDRADVGACTTLATAIWILDRLSENGQFEAVCNFFPPTDTIRAEAAGFPEIQDLCHEAHAIQSMHWIIRHRNDDCTGFKSNTSTDLKRPYMDDCTAAGSHHLDLPSRRRFEAILEMIPHECIEEAVHNWMFACHDIMVRLKQSHDLYDTKRKHIYRDAQDLNKSARAMMNAVAPGTALEQYSRPLMCRTLYDRSNVIEQEMQQIDSMESRLICGIGMSHIMSDEKRAECFGAEASTLWEDIVVHDPYGMCFAFLYLIDRDEYLPWAYGVSGILMDRCRYTLPWCVTVAQFEADTSEQYDNTAETDVVISSYYGTFVADRCARKDAVRQRYNLAQIIYLETGFILPRAVCGYEESEAWLDRFGLLDTRLGVPMLNTISLLHALSIRSCIPKDTQTQAKAENTEALQQCIRELEAEKKQLRQERHEADRAVQAFREKLDAMEAAVANDRRELAELRELLFCRDRPEEDAAAEIKAIGFPAHTERNILVYGGHDSWLREIRKKLPDARFIQQQSKVDPQLIRNADEIWFQTNSLSHKLYNAVTQHAARHNVRIRYFHYASAAKCAEELVLAQRT